MTSSLLVNVILSPYFWLNIIFGILLIEYALFKTKVLRNVNELRDGMYPAFRRIDVKYWTRERLYRMAPFVFPRFMICILQVGIHLPICKILMIGENRGREHIPAWKTKALKYLTLWTAKVILIFGPMMLTYEVERPNVDYKKYLGPDWKPSYEKPSTIVANHSCWVDIVLITLMKFPSFTPKIEIQKWPVIGQVCDIVFNSYFVNRAGTAEERQKIITDIGERQLISE